MSRNTDNFATVLELQGCLGIKQDGWGADGTRRAMRRRLLSTPPSFPSILPIDRSLRLPLNQYLSDVSRKSLIVLHHTAGATAESTFNYWRSNGARIGTAYIVARDGRVYEVFPPEKWAYHLGIKKTRGRVDRRSIGIEIASEGGLTNGSAAGKRRRLYSFDVVSDRTEFHGPVYEAGDLYRGYSWFASYTPEAIASVGRLVDDLCSRFDIPRRTPSDHLSYSRDLRDFEGVLGHNHLRRDKSDLHPGFNWKALNLDAA